MPTKTETLWENVKNLCLEQAFKTIETEPGKIPNSVCAEIADRLVKIAIAIDKHGRQEEWLNEMNGFCDSIRRS